MEETWIKYLGGFETKFWIKFKKNYKSWTQKNKRQNLDPHVSPTLAEILPLYDLKNYLDSTWYD